MAVADGPAPPMLHETRPPAIRGRGPIVPTEHWSSLAAGARALAVAAEVGGVALAIDAQDGDAARWYARFGAVPLLDDPLKLILPLAVIAEACARGALPEDG